MDNNPPHIRRSRRLPRALDFQALLELGVARAQALSGEEWTDYNAHDPGVTILEQACFALTDIAYRASHPVEDILATLFDPPGTGKATAKPAPIPQAFPTADAIMTTAPVTADDFRAVICDRHPEVRNVWLTFEDDVFAADGTPCPVVQVSICLFPTPTPDPYQAEKVRAAVDRLLQDHRLLGQRFAPVALLRPREIAISATVEAADDYDANDLIAAILHNVDMALCPPPRFESVDDRLAAMPVDQAFDGPRLCYSAVEVPAPPPLGARPGVSEVRNIILATPGVVDVRGLEIKCIGDDTAKDKAPTCYTVAAGRPGFERIRVDRHDEVAGTDLDPVQPFAQLVLSVEPGEDLRERHIEASRMHRLARLRSTRQHARRALETSEALKVPGGKRRPRLGDYRSIQFDFPEIYDLAPGGHHASGQSAIVDGDGRKPETAKDRRDRILNFRSYLSLLEQPLANMLAQLYNVPRLLSGGPAAERTYFHASLLPQDDGDADAPPDFRLTLRDADAYPTRLAEITQQLDAEALRYEQILDHLLARFDEAFETDRLVQFTGPLRQDKIDAAQKRIKAKQAFLADYAALGARRGSAATAPDVEALALRIQHKTGLPSLPTIVDHALLANAAPANALEEAAFFPFEADAAAARPGRRAVPAVRAAAYQVRRDGAHAFYGIAYDWTDGPGWPAILDLSTADLAASVADGAAPDFLAPHTDRVRAVLSDGGGRRLPRFELLERWRSPRDAAAALDRLIGLLADPKTELKRALFPAPFCANRLTILFDASPESMPEYRQFVEATAHAEAPAHLELAFGWAGAWPTSFNALTAPNFKALQSAWTQWRAAIRDGRPPPASGALICRTIAAFAFQRRHSDLIDDLTGALGA